MKTLLLTIFFCIFFTTPTKARTYDDFEALGYHYEVCNTCINEEDFKRVAFASASNEKVVITNFFTGVAKAYTVVDLNEPDIPHLPVIYEAYPVDVPAEAQDVSNRITTFIAGMKAGSPMPVSSAPETFIVISELVVPPTMLGSDGQSINTGSAREILDNPAASAAVSHYIKTYQLPNLWLVLTAGLQQKWSLVIKNIGLTVKTRYQDNSVTEWVIGNPFESYNPYSLVQGSAKDANGNQIHSVSDNLPLTHTSTYDVYSGFNPDRDYFSFTEECKAYFIEYSFGQRSRSQICFIVGNW